MSTMNVIYINTTEKIDLVDLPILRVISNDKWIGIELFPLVFKIEDQVLNKYSQMGVSSIFLSFQSAVDAFQFTLSNNGSIERKLVYGCYDKEREWEIVQGIEQDWEQEVFFNEVIEEKAMPIELEEGARFPSLDSRVTCGSIAEYYDFPGWS